MPDREDYIKELQIAKNEFKEAIKETLLFKMVESLVKKLESLLEKLLK